MPRRPPPAIFRLGIAVAMATALVSAHGQTAEPAGNGDAVLQLLHDKGLLPREPLSPRAEVVRQVRDKASELVLSAMDFLGVPYKRGGNSAEEGFDCSGFTRHIFERSIGLVLPRRADEQAHAAGVNPIRREELKPGDLVFFNTLKRTFSHVGIYIGEGKFIHAPRSGSEVRIEDMRVAYWQHRFTGARRADGAALPANGGASAPMR
jgi:cell wall-associated NlpC family hydrolase